MINNPFVEKGIIACQYCGSGEYLYNEDGNRIATAVSVVLRLTGRRTKTVGRVQMLTCQNMECCVKSNIKMAEKIRLF